MNIQPLDLEKRAAAGFKNLGENMWRDGDRLGASLQSLIAVILMESDEEDNII